MKFLNFLFLFIFAWMSVSTSFAQITPVTEQSLEKQYIANGGFEQGKSKWSVYADAAGASPVDCNGGSPTVSISTSTTSPIAGAASGVLTKPASNVQGQGYKTDFALDKAAKTKIVTVTGSYEIASGTYSGGSSSTDSDLIAYIYDVDGAVAIQPTAYKLSGSVAGNVYEYSVTFQAPTFATSTRSMRLCLHHATTSASAFTVKLDKVKATLVQKNTGVVVTDWETYTTNCTGTWSTNTTYTCQRRRVGDSREYNIRVATSGAPSGGVLAVNLAPGDVIDTAKLSSGAAANFDSNIDGVVTIGIASAYTGSVHLNDTTSVVAAYYDTNGNGAYVTPTAPATFAAGSFVSLAFKVPIVGLGSSVVESNNADSRVVAFNAIASGYSVPGSATAINNFNTFYTDTHGGGTISQYTIQVPGWYDISGVGTFTPAASTGGTGFLQIHVNGVQIGATTGQGLASAGQNYPGNIHLFGYKLKAGDVITLVTNQNTGNTVNLTIHFSVVMRQGPAQIAASETVTASYWLSANQTTSAQINFDSKEFDSHNAVTTGVGAWKFTAPIAGVYLITGFIQPGAAVTGEPIRLYKNGSYHKRMGYLLNNTAASYPALANTVKLLAGDYIDIRPSGSTTFGGGSLASDGTSNISITKVGN